MKFNEEDINKYIVKWQDTLRLRDWDIKYEIVNNEWRKTGDIKIDSDDRKAISDPKFNFAYSQFMTLLEFTVEDLSKSFIKLGAEDKVISFGRVQKQVELDLGDI